MVASVATHRNFFKNEIKVWDTNFCMYLFCALGEKKKREKEKVIKSLIIALVKKALISPCPVIKSN